VSGIFAGSWQAVRALWNGRPIRRFLGDHVDERLTLSIFVRDMVSADRKYYSQLPTGEVQQWQNFPVVGRTDVEVVTDVLNLLGKAGRSSNIAWRQLTRDWDLWSEPILCVGGNFKTEKVLTLCEPRLVKYDPPQTFTTLADKKVFDINDGNDYGLIYRGRHSQTGASCLILFGFGSAGTEAAGAYLRRKAHDLASLYGPRPFAAIIRIRPDDGRESGSVVWLSPDTSPFAPIFHFLAWHRHRRLIAQKSAA